MRSVGMAALVVCLFGADANAQDLEKSFLLCKDVRTAAYVHQAVSADKTVWRAIANEVLDKGTCDVYQGSHRWRLMETNRTYGYMKILYDRDTQQPKVGFMPFFQGWAMGLE